MSNAISYILTTTKQSNQEHTNKLKKIFYDFCRCYDIELLKFYEDIVEYEFHNPIRNGSAGKEMLNFIERNSNFIDFFLVDDLTKCVEEDEWEQLRSYFSKHNIEVVELFFWRKLRPVMDLKYIEEFEKEIESIKQVNFT